MPPFWAITRHADIHRISREPELFLSSPMLAIFPREQFDPEGFAKQVDIVCVKQEKGPVRLAW